MVESIGYVFVTLTLVSFGCFAWFKYQEEHRRNRKLSSDNMTLTMENYNLRVARTNVVPITKKTKFGKERR